MTAHKWTDRRKRKNLVRTKIDKGLINEALAIYPDIRAKCLCMGTSDHVLFTKTISPMEINHEPFKFLVGGMKKKNSKI